MVDRSRVRSNEVMTSANHHANSPGAGADTIAVSTVHVGIGPLSFADVVAVARHEARVEITANALAGIRKSRKIIEALADDVEPHYGVSTGFGALATKHIAPSM